MLASSVQSVVACNVTAPRVYTSVLFIFTVKVAMYSVLYMCKAICSLQSFCWIAYAVWLLMEIASQQPKVIKVSVMHDVTCSLVTGTLSRCIYIACDTVLYLSSLRPAVMKRS